MYDNKVISNNIRVYPCSNRNPESDYTARLTTEYNLVSIINRLVDMKSFCVSTFQGCYLGDDTTKSLISSINEFMFNINGYLFNLNNITADADKPGQFTQLVSYLKEQFDIAETNNTLYACICVGQSSDNSPFIELLSSTEAPSSASSTALSQEQIKSGSYLGNMDVKDGGDTYFNGVTFVVGQWIEPGERGQNWQKIAAAGDTSIFGKFTTDSSGTTVKKFILPIVQVETTAEEGGKTVASTFSVPQDSRVKFATIKNGSVRSVTIDDGVLE